MGLNFFHSILLVFFLVDQRICLFSCPSTGYFPDPNSCTSFYRCLDDQTSHKYLCPFGTRYDTNLKICNHEELVPTCNLGSTSKPTKPNTTRRTTKRPTRKPTERITTKSTTTLGYPDSPLNLSTSGINF